MSIISEALYPPSGCRPAIRIGCVADRARRRLAAVVEETGPASVHSFSACETAALAPGAAEPETVSRRLGRLRLAAYPLLVVWPAPSGYSGPGEADPEELGGLFYPVHAGLAYQLLFGGRCECCGDPLAMELVGPLSFGGSVREALVPGADAVEVLLGRLGLPHWIGLWADVAGCPDAAMRRAALGNVAPAVTSLPLALALAEAALERRAERPRRLL